jgi:hypothetical protein
MNRPTLTLVSYSVNGRNFVDFVKAHRGTDGKVRITLGTLKRLAKAHGVNINDNSRIHVG